MIQSEEAVVEQEHVSSVRFPFVFCRDEKSTRTPLAKEEFLFSALTCVVTF